MAAGEDDQCRPVWVLIWNLGELRGGCQDRAGTGQGDGGDWC